MKISKLRSEKSVFRSIITICTCMLLSAIMFTFTGCSSDDDDKTVYTVTFETDGGTPVPSVQKVEESSTVTAPSPNPTKTGYVFVYWHLSEATTAYNFQSPVKNDFTLYAKWQNETTAEYWQVTWNLNGGSWGSGDSHASQVIKGGTLAEPNAPTKSGSTFDGWYKESGLTNKVNFPYDVSNVTADFALYAKWATGSSTGDPEGYIMFTSISALKSWLESQPENTVETPYKIGLKSVNLDAGSNWTDLGVAIGQTEFVDLNLQGCTGTAIPDGRIEVTVGTGGKVTTTYYGAFVGCRLTAIALPESVKTIGKYAFCRCRRLKSINLPSGLTEIRASAFGYTDALQSISLPAGLEIIGNMAFSSSGLTSIIIPGSVKDLNINTFGSCGSLRSVVLEEGVENIGERVFYWSNLIKSVTLPSSLKTIGKEAFSGELFSPISLPTITIPASVTRIDESAFSAYTYTDEVIMLPTTPPILGSGIFSTKNNSGEFIVIKVPAASLDAYKTTSGWSSYASYIVANTN